MRFTPVLLCLLLLPACAKETPPAAAGQVRVVAAFYPLAFLAEQVGGDGVAVTDLTPAATEPHDLELSPSQVQAVGAADVVLHIKGFQPGVDAAIPRGHGLDLADGEGDPHIWLDPVRFLVAAEAVAERLPGEQPGLASLRTRLQALDAEYAAGLKTCARREVVTSHEAFGRLAARYGLTQVAIAGISPDEEPSPARLADVARLVRDKGVTTVFTEELVSPELAETVARETGARTAVLDPIEGAHSDGDYLTRMRANLTVLRTALDCR